MTQFNWAANTNKNWKSIIISQNLANFFANDARKSHHKFDSENTRDKLFMYNFYNTHIEGDVADRIYFMQKSDFPDINGVKAYPNADDNSKEIHNID